MDKLNIQKTGRIAGICISPKRGTAKTPVESAKLIAGFGLENDAHAGNWHRQVSLLSKDKVDAFNEKGAAVSLGDFGENILVEGFDPAALETGTKLHIGQAVLEITQIGKECHSHCSIFYRVGECIMPKAGTFAKVLQSGQIAPGDEILIEAAPFKLTAAVITCSDKGAAGQREDLSGPKAKELLEAAGYEVIETIIIPDDQKTIEKELIRFSDARNACLIVTTGGTGFSPKDVTPEATLAVAHRQAQGIAQAILVKSLQITDKAMLSRAVSVIRGQSVIVNLPGSPKAVQESLEIILPALEHGIKTLRGVDSECAAPLSEKVH